MNYTLTDGELAQLLAEDVPYGDLTTHLLGIGQLPGRIVFTTREATTLCCTEEAAGMLRQAGASVSTCLPSGSDLGPGVEFLLAQGPAAALHTGWKAALNLMEYACGIASRTRRIVDRARSVNPGISLVGTRKSFPGTKRVAIKALCAGGALPHRLGLSETVLVFRQHTEFLGGLAAFLADLPALRAKARENKIIVEADSAEEALLVARSGADIVQLDKMPPAELARTVAVLRQDHPGLLISAAGGINESNAADYAATGVDIIVLSSVYFGKPSDIAVGIGPL